MYYDLSLLPSNLLELNHLLKTIKETAIGAVAIDYEFTDTLITPPPDSFNKLKVISQRFSSTTQISNYSVESPSSSNNCHTPSA
jgi:hypothetical protein